jgi:tRNA(adenine34) deaminase
MQQKFMKAAILLAIQAKNEGEVPVGAVVVREGKIVGRGRNKRNNKQIATKHAEIIAIEAACKKLKSWRLDNCELYVTLEPCAMCIGACFNARIKQVYFGAFDERGGACGSVLNVAGINQLNHNLNAEGGILKEECAKLLIDFFKERRKNSDNK